MRRPGIASGRLADMAAEGGAEGAGGTVADALGDAGLPPPQHVFCQSVWRAVNDTTGTLRFPAGADAVALVA